MIINLIFDIKNKQSQSTFFRAFLFMAKSFGEKSREIFIIQN